MRLPTASTRFGFLTTSTDCSRVRCGSRSIAVQPSLCQPSVGQSWASARANAKAMSPTGLIGPNRLRGLRKAMATIRALWGSGGQLVNRDSPYFPLRNALFDLPPYRGKWPEIWIAAHGPRMLRAAGRYGDAFYPAFPHRPEGYKQRLDAVRSAASDAGRDPESIIPAVQLFVIT